MSKSDKRKAKPKARAKRRQRDPKSMAITRDISTLPEHLYDYSIEMMTAFGYFAFGDGSKTLSIAPDADGAILQTLRDSNFVMPMRISFSVAVECLLKAVLLKHEVPIISDSHATTVAAKLDRNADNYVAAKGVVDFVGNWGVYADSWEWGQRQLAKANIVCMFDVSTGMLGELRGRLGRLVDKGIITIDESRSLTNSLIVFAAMRRNVDVHTFFGMHLAGGIQHDLPNLYVPMVNTLVAAYWR